jgi:hypothetical protein
LVDGGIFVILQKLDVTVVNKVDGLVVKGLYLRYHEWTLGAHIHVLRRVLESVNILLAQVDNLSL